MDRRLTTILSADVAPSGGLSGPDAGAGIAAAMADTVLPLVTGAGGRVITSSGHALTAEFGSVVNALSCATDIRQRLAGQSIAFRAGINLWDMVVTDGNFDEGMDVATRLRDSGEPGSILITETVHAHVHRHLSLTFEDAGQRALKEALDLIPTFRVLPGAAERPNARSGAAYQASIAVLPFSNISGDPEQNYLSAGLSEELTAQLARISTLYVASPGSDAASRLALVNLNQLAVGLGVQYILRGNVTTHGEQVRVTVQLIDGHIDSKVLAQGYERLFRDVHELPGAIAEDIVHALRLTILPDDRARLDRRPAVDSEAYRFYLMGRSYFRGSHSRRFLRLARQMFLKALEIEPQHAASHAGLADCCAFLLEAGDLSISPDEILSHSERALAFDDRLAEAHASRGLGLYAQCSYAEAEASFEAAIRLQPDLFEAHYFYGRNCLNQGQFSRAADLFGKAAKLRKDDFRCLGLQSMCYLSLAQMEEARNAARAALARAEMALAERPDDSDVLSFGAGLLAFLGEAKRTRAWSERATLIAPDDYYVQYNLACADAVIGDSEQAMDRLERIMTEDTPKARFAYMLQDSDLDSLREMPRYKAWVERLARMELVT